MQENTYKQIFHYIQQSEASVSPHELSRVTGKSRVSVHTALKKLLKNGDIQKFGLSPRVRYALKGFIETAPADLSLEGISARIALVLRKYPVAYAGILGGFNSAILQKDSIVNMMVGFHQPFPTLGVAAIERSLTEAIGLKVDLITDQGANKYIKSSMLSGLKLVYGKI